MTMLMLRLKLRFFEMTLEGFRARDKHKQKFQHRSNVPTIAFRRKNKNL